MSRKVVEQAVIPPELAGERLDRALAAVFPAYSRSRLQAWLKAGQIRVDGESPRPREPVRGGEAVHLEASLEPEAGSTGPAPQPLALSVVHEDGSLLVLDKPAGLVVHPGAGNPDRTLQNALLHRCPELAGVPRAGIVHRLDKDTSGLMVVARTLAAHTALVAQLQARRVGREYLALVNGRFTGGGRVEAPVGRHPRDRTRMAVVAGGRPAVTRYRVEERFPGHTLLRCALETGRTHQIRVHMASIRHPIVGDPVYGGRVRLPPEPGPEVTEALRGFRRQALHATRLTLVHPESGETLGWEAPAPADFLALLAILRRHRDASR